MGFDYFIFFFIILGFQFSLKLALSSALHSGMFLVAKVLSCLDRLIYWEYDMTYMNLKVSDRLNFLFYLWAIRILETSLSSWNQWIRETVIYKPIDILLPLFSFLQRFSV